MVAGIGRSVLLFAAALAALVILLAVGALVGNSATLFAAPGPLARLSRYLTHNTATTGPASFFPELRYEEIHAPAERVGAAVVAAASELGWKRADGDGAASYFHFVLTTGLFHFKDDIHVTLLQEPTGNTLLHIESASRVGRGDFGANLAHARDLRQIVKAHLGG